MKLVFKSGKYIDFTAPFWLNMGVILYFLFMVYGCAWAEGRL